MLPHVDILGGHASSYLVMLGLALVAGCVVAGERAKRDGANRTRLTVIAVVTAVAGVAGARIWSLLLERWVLVGDLDTENLFSASGFGLIGGLLAGALSAMASARLLSVSVDQTTAALAPGVASGISVGRIGCLLAGCCYGRPTLFPIALVFTDWDTAARPIGVPLHATQIYEAIGAGLLAILLWRAPPHRRVALLLIGYGLLRALLEVLRADYRGRIAGLPTTQVAAWALIAIGLVILTRRAGLPRRVDAEPAGR